jgi:hypothetical protein
VRHAHSYTSSLCLLCSPPALTRRNLCKNKSKTQRNTHIYTRNAERESDRERKKQAARDVCCISQWRRRCFLGFLPTGSAQEKKRAEEQSVTAVLEKLFMTAFCSSLSLYIYTGEEIVSSCESRFCLACKLFRPLI